MAPPAATAWACSSSRPPRPSTCGQEWAPYERISPQLKRAVIASEDAGFAEHSGVEWDALEKAWERNQKAEERVARINAEMERRAAARQNGRRTASIAVPPRPT